MTELPSGTVTFLFTDIAGSTQLLQQLGADRYGNVLAAQRTLLRAVFKKFNGLEIDTQGDAFFVSFRRASEAAAAVVAMQRSLAGTDWPEGVSVRVRMGLHTGEPLVAEEGYVGLDVHLAERLRLYCQADRILMEEAAIVPTVYPVNHHLVKLWLKNYNPNDTLMKNVILEPHEA